LRQFVANSGKVWLCGACTKPRGITEEQLTAGVSIVGAAKVVEEVVAGARTIAFA
jgi:sulfur relay (sulfurtransferase) complex TusBCD TusD component (DsrE family)